LVLKELFERNLKKKIPHVVKNISKVKLVMSYLTQTIIFSKQKGKSVKIKDR
jgi:hypothetical protein